MKRNCLIVILFTSLMLLLSLSAYAGSGDCTVQLNGGGANNKVYIGEDNIFEILVTNPLPMSGMSLGFEFTSTAGAFDWTQNYGSKPTTAGCAPYCKVVMQHGDVIDKFDLGGLKVTITKMPDSVLIGGAVSDSIWPAHLTPTLVYSMKLTLPDVGQPDVPGGFCVRDIFFPPAGTWTFNDGAGGFPPTFNSQTISSELNPDSLPVCFDVVKRPCQPPVWSSNPAAAVSFNHCAGLPGNGPAYSFDFNATEGGNNPPANPVTYTTTAGSIDLNTGVLTVNGSAQCGTTDVVVTAHNSCGGTVNWPFTITWTNSNPVIDNCPQGPRQIGMGNAFTYNFIWHDPDPCDGATWTVAQTCGPDATGRFGINDLGQFYFNTLDPSDGDSTFCFCAYVTDPCGGKDTCCISVEVKKTAPWIIHIEKTHKTFQGHYEYVSIFKIQGSGSMGGFDFLLAYDATALSFISAKLGVGLVACDWEYFTYRYGAFGNCTGPCPSGNLRVVAIADQNNGAHHPLCYDVPGIPGPYPTTEDASIAFWNSPAAKASELVELKFYVTNDRNFDCMYLPIVFKWYDCGDNAISNKDGDSLFIGQGVFTHDWNGDPSDTTFKLLYDAEFGFVPYYGGPAIACSTCTVFYPNPYPEHPELAGLCKNKPYALIWFWNGGIDIFCKDSIDARGDINLNGIMNEIADAVLYTNYFLYGFSALDPLYFEAQRAASDINNDGMVLTVGDLVYLLRIIVGDALPFPKLAPFANDANITVVDGLVSTEASTEIGAVYATFTVNGTYSVVNHSNMKVDYAESNGELKVLVWSGTNNLTNRVSVGDADLFAVTGNVELKTIEVSDYNGNMLTSRVNKTALPTSFALAQNVPNPFNPTTKIGLSLPTVSDWSVDIYNIAGQLVKSFNGRGVGNITIDWDASNVASGVYFYKATAGSFTDTKKMVLMK